jgi:hypothetical protein
MPIRTLDQRVLYRDQRFHAAFPSILRLEDGHLLLAFRRARDAFWLVPEAKRAKLNPLNHYDHIDSRSHVWLQYLDNQGHPLDRQMQLPMDPEAGDQDASLLLLPGNRVFLASFAWYPLPAGVTAHLPGCRPPGDEGMGCRFLFWGSHASLLDSESNQWLHHHSYLQPDAGYGSVLMDSPYKGIVGASRGQALLRDGQIWLPVYGGPTEGAALFGSQDEGRSWQFRSIIACDPEARISYQEPALCLDKQGKLHAFMRTAGADGRLATSSSSDGLNWTVPKLHQLVGHPFHPLKLADGRVLLSYGYREPPFGIRARLLDDASSDPDGFPEIVLREDGLSPDLGYPWAAQLADGRVLVVYYLTDQQGIRQIAANWLEIR